ncbi:biopolymer transporter ExbD [bacterium]|nr:biopolymer transporter ExbD [bacterium]PJA75727.1 MAG: biopolymer transporter ExbD [bacterium CG_4_9_14_3_um_filter_65_15]
MGLMKKKKKEALGELRMDSTADVAFLLLIFFIVTTIFAAEQGLTLVLPGKQKQENTVKVKQSNIATLFVQADDSVTLDGKPIVINHIMNSIQDRIYSNPKLVVLLKVHPDADYGYMVACLDELKLANATKVSLKTATK